MAFNENTLNVDFCVHFYVTLCAKWSISEKIQGNVSPFRPSYTI